MSIRRKLLLWLLLAFVVVFGAIGFTTVSVVRAELTERLDRTMVDGVQGAVTASVVLTREQASAFSQRPNETAWIVVTASGAHVGQTAQDAGGDISTADLSGYTLDELLAGAGEPFTVTGVDGTTRLRAVAAPFDDGSALVMVRSMSSIDDTISSLQRQFVVIAGAALIVSIVAVAVTARAAVRPVEDMIDLAHAIGEGEMSRRASAANDSTEVGRLADALNAMLERLETAFRDREASELRLREFLSDASHELRNPLTSIRAHAEMYRNPSFSPDDAQRYAARIEAETVRMGRLVDDLLLLARLDQGTELEVGEVDMALLVAQAVDATRVIDPARPMAMEVPDEPVVVTGDGRRLRLVVDNLLTNVRVHAGPRAAVAVRVRRSGGDVVVSVTDDGPGVEAAELARLADRFYRAAPARSQGRPGTGLGLAIVSAVVTGHSGTLALRSDGDGFTAELRLPLAPVSPKVRQLLS